MNINSNTKIASLLKQNPGALEAIISINSKFEKLRNPLLRKLMAGRTSIQMASKISGNSLEEFYSKLEPLGFEIDKTITAEANEKRPAMPAFFKALKPELIVEFDVRPVIDANIDPLSIIEKKVKSIQQGEALKIINSFEPTPLIALLKKQGFESYVDAISDQLVETYFYKKDHAGATIGQFEENVEDWDVCMKRFQDKIQTIDVQTLAMPGPMMSILDALEKLPSESALFVYHKRIPIFLLPELKERGFDYRVKEIAPNEVHLLIFKV